jgi:predicted acyltransferase
VPERRPAPRTRGARWDALDDLRGLSVLVMVPVNVAAPFLAIPAWFKHAPANGLTIADFVVPGFLFALGLSASFSFKARVAKDGLGKTFLHALLRYGLLFVFGTVGLLVDRGARWETLQMLGATGMFVFFFLLLSPWPRLAAAAVLLAAVEALRPLGLGELIQRWYDTGLGGPWGTFSLSFFALCASALGELTRESSPRVRLLSSVAMAAVLGVAGIVASRFFPFSKHLLSLSYILFTCGVSSALLALFVVYRDIMRLPLPFVGSLGRNPLLLYMLHAVLGVAALAIFTENASGWTAWAASIGVLALCVAAAEILDRKRVYIKL